MDVGIDSVDPTRCVDIRPVHLGILPELTAFILKQGYLRHQRILVVKDHFDDLVIVDGRHRVVCCQTLVREEKLPATFTLPAILLKCDTPQHVLVRLATGLFLLFSAQHTQVGSF